MYFLVENRDISAELLGYLTLATRNLINSDFGFDDSISRKHAIDAMMVCLHTILTDHLEEDSE
jgi:hypothetical protein